MPTFLNTLSTQSRLPTFESYSVKISRYALPIIVGIHLLITILLSIILNIWIDEAHSLHTAGQDIEYAIKRALYFELQPPLYFIILDLWRSINPSIFFARLLSICFMALMLVAVWRLSVRLYKETHPAWLVAATALNPFVVWYATEIRCYALVILLSALLLLFFLDGYLSEGFPGKSRWYYIFLAIGALYTHYYLGFILAANGLTLLILGRLRTLRAYLLGMFIVLLCFAPMLMVLRDQTSIHLNFSYPVSLYGSVKVIHWRIKEYLLPSGNIWGLVTLSKWIFNLGTVVGLFYVVKKRTCFFKPYNVALITMVVTICIFFFALLNLYGRDSMMPRHLATLFLPSILLTFSVIPLVNGRKVLISCCLVLFLFYGSALVGMYKRCAKDGDWQRVATYIMKVEKAGEPILIIRNEQVLPFTYYYNGPNKVIPLPNKLNVETYDLSSQVLRDEQTIFQSLPNVPGDDKKLWVITNATVPYLGVDIHPEVLEGFINKWCVVEKEQSFYGSLVRYVALKENWKTRVE